MVQGFHATGWSRSVNAAKRSSLLREHLQKFLDIFFFYLYFSNMKLPYCVYVLFSEKDHQLYIGYTSDIKRRFNEHITGQNTSTKHRGPWKLIFIEYYLFKEDAIKREKYFKTTIGKRTLKILLSDTFEKLNYKNK